MQLQTVEDLVRGFLNHCLKSKENNSRKKLKGFSAGGNRGIGAGLLTTRFGQGSKIIYVHHSIARRSKI